MWQHAVSSSFIQHSSGRESKGGGATFAKMFRIMCDMSFSENTNKNLDQKKVILLQNCETGKTWLSYKEIYENHA